MIEANAISLRGHTLSPAKKSARYEALDGWRGVCAVLVVFYHMSFDGLITSTNFVKNSYLFVDFFFVLSGFVITNSYYSRTPEHFSTPVFILKRVARLWPLHIFVLSLYLSLELTQFLLLGQGFEPPREVASIPTNFFLIHALGMHQEVTWNGPSWSISVEMCAYLAFCVLIAINEKYRLAIAVIAVALSLLVLLIASPGYIDATYDFGFFRGISGFFFGYIIWRLRSNNAVNIPVYFEIITLIAITIFVSTAGKGPITLMAPLIFGCAVYVFSNESGALSRTLRLPLIQSLGRWSYSIYLIHMFIVTLSNGAVRVIGPQIGVINIDSRFTSSIPFMMDAFTIAVTVIIIGFSAITYRLVETPGRLLIERFGMKNVTSLARD